MKKLLWILVIAGGAAAAALFYLQQRPDGIDRAAPVPEAALEPLPDSPGLTDTAGPKIKEPGREKMIPRPKVAKEKKPVAQREIPDLPDGELVPWARKNYSFAYWKNGWRKNPDDASADILCFESGRYGLTLDLADFGRTRFGRFDDDTDYMTALQAKPRRTGGLADADFSIEVKVNGTTYQAVTCQAGIDKGVKHLQTARLWESGKLVQHFDLLGLVFKDETGHKLDCDGTLDIVVWPGTLTFNLKLAPEQSSWANTTLAIRLNDWNSETAVPGTWAADEKKQLTLTCNVNQLDQIKGGIDIRLDTPQQQSFPVAFDEAYNCFSAKIGKRELKRRFKTGYTDIRDYDEFDLQIENSVGKTYIPFQLALSSPANITGLCPILCEEDGTPTGIPVQLSKNWHNEALGTYLRAYALIPAKQGTSRYKLRIVYGFYGTLPSASHAQLSLVGYGNDGTRGNNGRWDQLAIGCWGETMCFDMDMSCVDNVVTDVRVLMARNGLNGKKWSWTDGGWGGDWLYLRDNRGQKLYFSGLKTAYVSQGPCLTEVHYDGFYGSQRDVDLKTTVQTLRTDDYARTFQTFAYTFTKPVSATDGWLFKMGKTSRLVTPTIAYGNGAGLIKEHKVPGSLNRGDVYLKQTELTGNGPWWVAFPGACKVDGKDWGTGWRALIIRSYQARIGGRIYTNPTVSFPVNRIESKGNINLDMILTPPKGVTQFEVGDTIAFEAEWITLPKTADDYYGPNETFRKHLEKYSNSWKSVYREALGNALNVQTSGGTVKHAYPLIIETTRPDDIQVKISGGVGAVPIRFEGLESPDYTLFQVSGKNRIELDQSVHGNDFWQTDYDPGSDTYSLTYNLPLDTHRTSGWVLKAVK